MPKIVIVTGASAGLGRALVRALVARGDTAIGIGRSAEALAETGAGLDPQRYLPRVCDVSDSAGIEAIVAETLATHGRVDALIANAAVYPHVSILDHAPADWMQTLAINVGGVYAAARAVLPSMQARAQGRIVIVGSFAWRGPALESSGYSVSKGALHVLSKSIAVEVGTDYPDILINEWVPGVLKTRMGLENGIEPEIAAQWGLKLIDLPAGGPSGQVFDRDQLVVPPRSLKRRVLDKLLMRG